MLIQLSQKEKALSERQYDTMRLFCYNSCKKSTHLLHLEGEPYSESCARWRGKRCICPEDDY